MSNRTKNILFMVILTAFVVLYSLSGNSIGMNPDFGESGLTVSVADYDYNIAYEEIESLELTDLPEPGKMIEGTETRSLRYGTWENQTWGKYTQCITRKADQCIVIMLKTGEIYVLNYQNNNSTVSLYNMFTDLLRSKASPS